MPVLPHMSLVLWLGLGNLAVAQNYVDVDSYGGQQVTVNFDALDDGAADPYSTTPFSNPGFVLQEDVPMATLPRAMPRANTAPQRLVLTPPSPMQPLMQASVQAPIQAPAPKMPALPQSVQPLGVTAASKPLSPMALPPVVSQPVALPPARVANVQPKPVAMPPPVPKAVPLPTPLPNPLPIPAPTLSPTLLPARAPTLAQMPDLAPAAMPQALPVVPVVSVTAQQIMPPPLPTPPTLNRSPDKAQALAPAAATMRANSAAAASTLQRLIFMVDSDVLTAQNRQQLADIGQLLAQETTARVQLRAYAMGTQDTISDARRLSLARGLAVRGQLLQLGAKPSQIDVRALGNGGGGLDAATGTQIPADRVDVIVLR